MSTLLNELKSNLNEGHILEIKPISEYEKNWNKTRPNVKDLYTIKITCPDSKAGQGFIENEFFSLSDIAPSKLSGHYYKLINNILDNFTNGKCYCNGYSECGKEIEYGITWNKNRKLK